MISKFKKAKKPVKDPWGNLYMRSASNMINMPEEGSESSVEGSPASKKASLIHKISALKGCWNKAACMKLTVTNNSKPDAHQIDLSLMKPGFEKEKF